MQIVRTEVDLATAPTGDRYARDRQRVRPMFCVPATVLAAIDHGFRTVIVTDANCSTADQTHDGALSLALQ